jgi:hypothetical protein
MLSHCVLTPSEAENVSFSNFYCFLCFNVLFYNIISAVELPMICSNMEIIVTAVEIYRNNQHGYKQINNIVIFMHALDKNWNTYLEGRLYAPVYSLNETTKRISTNCGMGGKLIFRI